MVDSPEGVCPGQARLKSSYFHRPAAGCGQGPAGVAGSRMAVSAMMSRAAAVAVGGVGGVVVGAFGGRGGRRHRGGGGSGPRVGRGLTGRCRSMRPSAGQRPRGQRVSGHGDDRGGWSALAAGHRRRVDQGSAGRQPRPRCCRPRRRCARRLAGSRSEGIQGPTDGSHPPLEGIRADRLHGSGSQSGPPTVSSLSATIPRAASCRTTAPRPAIFLSRADAVRSRAVEGLVTWCG
jgi:hypothetical protein